MGVSGVTGREKEPVWLGAGQASEARTWLPLSFSSRFLLPAVLFAISCSSDSLSLHSPVFIFPPTALPLDPASSVTAGCATSNSSLWLLFRC